MYDSGRPSRSSRVTIRWSFCSAMFCSNSTPSWTRREVSSLTSWRTSGGSSCPARRRSRSVNSSRRARSLEREPAEPVEANSDTAWYRSSRKTRSTAHCWIRASATRAALRTSSSSWTYPMKAPEPKARSIRSEISSRGARVVSHDRSVAETSRSTSSSASVIASSVIRLTSSAEEAKRIVKASPSPEAIATWMSARPVDGAERGGDALSVDRLDPSLGRADLAGDDHHVGGGAGTQRRRGCEVVRWPTRVQGQCLFHGQALAVVPSGAVDGGGDRRQGIGRLDRAIGAADHPHPRVQHGAQRIGGPAGPETRRHPLRFGDEETRLHRCDHSHRGEAGDCRLRRDRHVLEPQPGRVRARPDRLVEQVEGGVDGPVADGVDRGHPSEVERGPGHLTETLGRQPESADRSAVGERFVHRRGVTTQAAVGEFLPPPEPHLPA